MILDQSVCVPLLQSSAMIVIINRAINNFNFVLIAVEPHSCFVFHTLFFHKCGSGYIFINVRTNLAL